MAARSLAELQTIFPKLDIETIEVTTNPIKTLRAGIRLFPALKINNVILSGIFLTKARMQDFIAAQLNIQSALKDD